MIDRCDNGKDNDSFNKKLTEPSLDYEPRGNSISITNQPMMAALELFVLPMGPFPRRILMYLSERGLMSSPHIKITPVTIRPGTNIMEAPGKPPGTVPILKVPYYPLPSPPADKVDNQPSSSQPQHFFIRQSLAILDYLETVCTSPDPSLPWQMDISAAAAAVSTQRVDIPAATAAKRTSMYGATPSERARNLEILALADEVMTLFGFACHKGTQLFAAAGEASDPGAAALALETAERNLGLLDGYYDYEGGEGEGGFGDRIAAGGVPWVCDIVLFSMLQFAIEFYGRDLMAQGGERANLRRFYDVFKGRDSARIEEGRYPEELRALAKEWL